MAHVLFLLVHCNPFLRLPNIGNPSQGMARKLPTKADSLLARWSLIHKVRFRMHRTGWLLILFCLFTGIRMSGWRSGIALGVLLLASLLLHEAGHICAAMLLKVPVREFGLKLGGAYVKRAHSHRRCYEILIAISGPLLNLSLVVPLIFLPRLGIQIATCNLVIGFVNLLPLPASDGLRILRNLLGSLLESNRIKAPLPAKDQSDAYAALPDLVES
jgi:Zn-dependent protease